MVVPWGVEVVPLADGACCAISCFHVCLWGFRRWRKGEGGSQAVDSACFGLGELDATPVAHECEFCGSGDGGRGMEVPIRRTLHASGPFLLWGRIMGGLRRGDWACSFLGVVDGFAERLGGLTRPLGGF